jgi:LmbE family N-acetylglucosaminyl deacetylase
VVALSPHLDDAVWSVGWALADAARAGASVTVVTVLAGDPTSLAAAGPWDVRCGFRGAGKAAETRRSEDVRACALLGVEPVHLPFSDEQYARGGNDDDVWSAVARRLEGAETVLAPGFPLSHPDHAWLAGLVLDRADPGKLVLYAEQPYASRRARGREPLRLAAALEPRLPGPARWRAVRPSPAGRVAKLRASRAYLSQIHAARSPYRFLPERQFLATRVRHGGEALAGVGP